MSQIDVVHAAQERLVTQMTKALVRILLPFIGSRPKAKDLAKAMYPTVVASRKQQRTLADQSYKAFRKEAGIDPKEAPFVTVTIRDYTEGHLESGISGVYDEDSDMTAGDVKDVLGAADKHSSNAYRNTMQAYAIHDPRILGWARVSVGSYTCNWCLVLISRGAVYKTAETAGENNAYHNFDDCQVVPTFSKEKWDYPGGELGKQALADYYDGKLAKPKKRGGQHPRTQAVDDALEGELKAVRARIATLEAATPKSESAKKYTAAQLAKNQKQLAALTGVNPS